MIEADLLRLLAWPWANVCSDGELAGRHPRGYGSFPRVLGRYVREQGVVSLAEMIRKMTSLAAHNTGLTRRGELQPGWYADLVLFDPGTVSDRATTTAPQALSAGIARTWVNGVEVYRAGATTGARPGQILRRPAAL
jgi:N-acyl-D-amino-acid deacylase